MAHLLGTPTLDVDALPRPLTFEEKLAKKKKEEKWYFQLTAPIYKAAILYNNIQIDPIYYKKVYFPHPESPKGDILFKKIQYAPSTTRDDFFTDMTSQTKEILYAPIWKIFLFMIVRNECRRPEG